MRRDVLPGLFPGCRNGIVIALVYRAQDILYPALYGLRRYVVGLIVLRLYPPPPFGLSHGGPHRLRDPVGVEDHPPGHVPRRPPARLDERTRGAQEPFLVRVEYGYERYLRYVKTLPQEVYAYEDVEPAEAQVPDYLDPLKRLDVGMEVLDLDAELGIVRGEVLRRPLGKGGDEHPLALFYPLFYLAEEVVHLRERGPYLYLRVHQPGGADYLLGYVAA